jgi:hypothetical protein
MLSAKLIKSLENKGFFLEFPPYENKEDIIIEILKENNPRITASLILFLDVPLDYKKITKKLTKEGIKQLNKFILISEKIYKKENVQSDLNRIIKENKIKSLYPKTEFDNTYDLFKEARLKSNQTEQNLIEKQAKLRLNLDLNKSLAILFSPAKIKIMEKIFNHEKLTNTELKYYYKAISNIDKAVLTPALQDYLKIIEITKKERE